jgi:hypothetical protein
MAPKTSMAAASRVAGICFGKAFVRMASAPGPPEYPRLRWAARRRLDFRCSPSASDLGRQPLSLVDLAQNTQQTETF